MPIRQAVAGHTAGQVMLLYEGGAWIPKMSQKRALERMRHDGPAPGAFVTAAYPAALASMDSARRFASAAGLPFREGAPSDSKRERSSGGKTRHATVKNRTIDTGNNESLSRGVYEQVDGTFLALTFTESKTFKTRAGAERWFARHTRSTGGKRRHVPKRKRASSASLDSFMRQARMLRGLR